MIPFHVPTMFAVSLAALSASAFPAVASLAPAAIAPFQPLATTHDSAHSALQSKRGSAPAYTITDLGTLSGYGFEADAYSINNRGEIVGRDCCGSTSPPPPYEAAFSYVDGVLTNLGGVPGYSGSEANSISFTGYIAGTSSTVGSTGVILGNPQAVLFGRGQTKPLGFLPGDTGSAGEGVNDFGDVVGFSFGSNTGDTAVLFHGGKAYSLGPGVAFGINDLGVAIGYSASQAALFTVHQSQSLGTLGGPYSSGEAINQRGEAVGYSALNAKVNGYFIQHAFAYYDGRMHDIGVPAGQDFNSIGSDARGLNNLGEIVGVYFPEVPDYQNAAFVYADGVMRDLTSLVPSGSGWTLSGGASINDCGDIVGSGLHNGQYRAFLARPVHPSNPRLRAALGCRLDRL